MIAISLESVIGIAGIRSEVLVVLTEWKNRGVADIFVACVDGLKGARIDRHGVS